MRFPSLTSLDPRRARERLVHDLRSLTRDAEQLLEAAAEDVSDKAHHARKRLGTLADRVNETYQDLQDRGIKSTRTALKQTDRRVRSHPYQSAAITFALGMAVGLLLRRR